MEYTIGRLPGRRFPDLNQVAHYVLYMSQDTHGSNRSYYDNSSAGGNNITIPVEQTLPPFTHFVIYTLSSLAEQSTPAGHLVFDASAAGINFIDKDLDTAELGGLIWWGPPLTSVPERVVLYTIHMSESSVGTARLQLVDDRLMGTNELLMPSEMPLLNSTHLVVYTKSSLVEQTTPVPFLLHDIESSVTNITFPDHDLDFDGIGGVVAWFEPSNTFLPGEPSDLSQVTHYTLYMSYDAYGASRS